MSDLSIRTDATPLTDVECDALVLALSQGAADAGPGTALDEAEGGLLSAAVTSPAFRGDTGKTLAVRLRAHPHLADVVLVGLGENDAATLEGWRRAVAAGVRTARERGNRRIGVVVDAGALGSDARVAAAATEAAVLADYRYTDFKALEAGETTLEEIALCGPDVDDAAVQRAATVARCACWARDLINRSPSDKRPPELAEMAESMARGVGLTCEVIDAARAREIGLTALLAVGQGSTAEPRMVLLEHRPEGSEGPPVLLVGKGVTFDTGGISIKPARSMHEMKADMSGAAAVLATMRAVAETALPLHVAAVVPMAENMPSGDAYRPGDIVRSYGGTTIEVLNTDAEGRLILADALAYGRERFAPRCVVDMATLTGACVVALGEEVAGIMDNDEVLTAELIAAGESSGELLWRLPMFASYAKLIDSPVADIKNTGGRWGGAITAAKFLERFVGETPWAHIDIAGPAFRTKALPYVPVGGAGFGVRLLMDWLRTRSED